jgi:hypothetical protein
MRRHVFHVVALSAEGHPGIGSALTALRSAYLTAATVPPWTAAEQFATAIVGSAGPYLEKAAQ